MTLFLESPEKTQFHTHTHTLSLSHMLYRSTQSVLLRVTATTKRLYTVVRTTEDVEVEELFLDSVYEKLRRYVVEENSTTTPVIELRSPDELHRLFEEHATSLEIGKDSVDEEKLLKSVDLLLKYSVKTSHPLFLNQLYSRADPVGIAADWISTATNTNAHTFEVAPVYTLIERSLIRKISSVIGGRFDSAKTEGLFVPGGSISNLYGMHLARHRADPEIAKRGAVNGPRLVAFTSDQSHYSYLKSSRLTGLGSDNLIEVPSDENGRMCPEQLEKAVIRAKESNYVPFFCGSTAGTTVLGAYDPFDRVNEICQRHEMWHHVDACWGGGAMLLPDSDQFVKGLNQADSVSWNPHKMSGAPLQCSTFLTRHDGILKSANASSAAYLFQPDKLFADMDTGDKTIQCGRKTDMLKLWMMWKSKGDKGMAQSVQKCFDLAQYTADMIRESSNFELAYEPSCANVCFWYV